MTNPGNTKPKAAYLSGAARSVLQLPLGATTVEFRQRAIALLNEEDLQLPSPTFEAVTVLGLGQPANPVHFPILRQLGNGRVHELEDEIDEFRTAYFKFPPTDRQARWTDLRRQCTDYPFLTRRLTLLEQGLGLEPDVSHLSPDLQELAEAVLRMYTSTPRGEAKIRAEWREMADRNPQHWKNALELKRQAPEIAALKEKLLDELANWSAETRRRRQKARANRDTQLARNFQTKSESSGLWRIAIAVIILANFVGILARSGSNNSSKNPRTPQRSQPWIPPVTNSRSLLSDSPIRLERMPSLPELGESDRREFATELNGPRGTNADFERQLVEAYTWSRAVRTSQAYEDAKLMYESEPDLPGCREALIAAGITYGNALISERNENKAATVYHEMIPLGRQFLQPKLVTPKLKRLQARLLADFGAVLAREGNSDKATLCFAESLGLTQLLVDRPTIEIIDQRMHKIAMLNLQTAFNHTSSPDWPAAFRSLWRMDPEQKDPSSALLCARGFAVASCDQDSFLETTNLEDGTPIATVRRRLSDQELQKRAQAAAALLIAHTSDTQRWEEVRQQDIWKFVREQSEVQQLLDSEETAVPIAPQVSDADVSSDSALP